MAKAVALHIWITQWEQTTDQQGVGKCGGVLTRTSETDTPWLYKNPRMLLVTPLFSLFFSFCFFYFCSTSCL